METVLLVLLALASAAERPVAAATAAPPGEAAGATSGAARERVTKDGDLMVITLASGQRVPLRDTPFKGVAAPEVERHEYVAFLPAIRQHVVRVDRYDRVGYLLVDDRTGAIARLAGAPIVSPGGRFLACSEVNLVDGAILVLEIWRVEPGGVVLELRLGMQQIPGELAWRGDDELRVPLRPFDGRSAACRTFERSGARWLVRASCGDAGATPAP